MGGTQIQKVYLGTTLVYSVPSLTLKSNLISVWEMNEASGTVMTDSYGGHNGGYNDVTIGAGGNLGYSFYQNNSTNSYSYVNQNSALQPSASATISMWVKMNQTTSGTYYNFWSSWYSSTAELQFLIRAYGTSFQAYMYQSNLTQVGGSFGGITASSGIWMHVVLVADGSVVRFYKDGVQSSTTYSYNGTIKTGQSMPIYLGIRNGAGTFSGPLNGYVDQTAIWSRALSGTEVSNLYNSGSGLPYTGW